MLKEKSLRVISSEGFYYFMFTMVVMSMFSSIKTEKTKELILLLGITFAKEIASMHLSHLSGSLYSPIENHNFVLMSVFIFNISVEAWGIHLLDEYSLLVCLNFLAAASYAYRVLEITMDLVKELNTSVFRVSVKSI